MSKRIGYVIEEIYPGIAPAAVSAFLSRDRDVAYDEFVAVLGKSKAPRLVMAGPDRRPAPDVYGNDPLVIGAAGLRAVLAPAEYAALVQAPLAAALLES